MAGCDLICTHPKCFDFCREIDFRSGIISNGETIAGTENTRIGNSGNSITAASDADWADPTHEATGNMINMLQPSSRTQKFNLTYAPWNQLVEVYDDDQSAVVQTK